MIAISVDSPEKARKLARRLEVTMALLSDERLATIRTYGVADEENGIAWPAVFIVGKDGKVAWRSLTERYDVRPAPEVFLEALR